MTTKKQKDRLAIAKAAYEKAREDWYTAADTYYVVRKKYMLLLDKEFEYQDLYRPITPKETRND